MGNVRLHPRYVPREPSLHGHPTPVKKYGLLCTHLGRKFAIKRTVHLLLGDAEALLTRSSVRLVPFPACPAAAPSQQPSSQGSCTSPAWLCSSFSFHPLLRSIGCIDGTDPSLIFVCMSCSHLPAQAPLPWSPPSCRPCPPLRFDSHVPSRQSRFWMGPPGPALLYMTLCD